MLPQQETSSIVVITLAPDQLKGTETKIKIGLKVDGKIISTHTTTFMAPEGGSS
jgi:hypothetical protein